MKYLEMVLKWILVRVVGLGFSFLLLPLAFRIPKQFYPFDFICIFIVVTMPIWFTLSVEHIQRNQRKIPKCVLQTFAAKGFSITSDQKQEIEEAFWDFIEIHKGTYENYTMPSYVLNELILSYQQHQDLFEKMTSKHLNRSWKYEANPDFRNFKFRRKKYKIKHFSLRNNKRLPAYLRTYYAFNKKGRGGGSKNLPDVFLLDWTLENLGGVSYSLKEILHIEEHYHPNSSFKTNEMASTAIISGVMLEKIFEDYQDEPSDYEHTASYESDRDYTSSNSYSGSSGSNSHSSFGSGGSYSYSSSDDSSSPDGHHDGSDDDD